MEIIVYGAPAPQGSKRHVGRGILGEGADEVGPLPAEAYACCRSRRRHHAHGADRGLADCRRRGSCPVDAGLRSRSTAGRVFVSRRRGVATMRDCPVSGTKQDSELHAAVLRLRAWFRRHVEPRPVNATPRLKGVPVVPGRMPPPTARKL